MPQANSLSKVVRPLPRGRITLPIEFRRRLNIDDKSMLRVSLKGTKIEIIPLRPLPQQEPIREYVEDEIKRFLKEDRLDRKTARKVRRLLGRRA